LTLQRLLADTQVHDRSPGACGIALNTELVDAATLIVGRSPNIASDVRMCCLMF